MKNKFRLLIGTLIVSAILTVGITTAVFADPGMRMVLGAQATANHLVGELAIVEMQRVPGLAVGHAINNDNITLE